MTRLSAVYLQALRRRAWVILVLTLLFSLAGLLFVQLSPTTYQATQISLVRVKAGMKTSDIRDAQSTLESTAVALKQLLVTSLVKERVSSLTGFTSDSKELQSLSARIPTGTTFIEVSAVADTPEAAARIANAAGRALSEGVSLVSPSSAELGPLAEAVTIADAEQPSRSSKIPLRLGVLLGGFMGFCIAFGIATVWELLRTDYSTDTVGGPA